jgi:hypothetical protein
MHYLTCQNNLFMAHGLMHHIYVVNMHSIRELVTDQIRLWFYHAVLRYKKAKSRVSGIASGATRSLRMWWVYFMMQCSPKVKKMDPQHMVKNNDR